MSWTSFELYHPCYRVEFEFIYDPTDTDIIKISNLIEKLFDNPVDPSISNMRIQISEDIISYLRIDFVIQIENKKTRLSYAGLTNSISQRLVSKLFSFASKEEEQELLKLKFNSLFIEGA